VSLDPNQPEIGNLFVGKYRIERKLGQGGMGAVFAAHHELLHQRVAIKVLSTDVVAEGEVVTRFLNEARAAARIVSEHVARVTDVATLDNGVPYMVLELLEGDDLSKVLETRGALPVALAVDWVLQACAGVAKAHALGVVHRDLKPSNLFLARREDGTSVIKVLDFGISKSTNPALVPSSTLTATGSMIGSPCYMAPEQVRNAKHVDGRTDIWAIGVILHELLTTNRPFGGETLGELLVAIVEQQPPPISATRRDVPPGLERVVARCLRRAPAERFASIAELAQALEPYSSRAGGPSAGPMFETAVASLPAAPTFDSGSGTRTPPHAYGTQTAESWGETGVARRSPSGSRFAPMLAGAGAVLFLVLAGLAYRSLGDRREPLPSAAGTSTPSAPASLSGALPARAAEAPPPAAPVPLAPEATASVEAPAATSGELAAPPRPAPKRKHEQRPGVTAPTTAPHAPGAAAVDDLPDQSRQ
jgi:eukaryotic-like serine/threonine-protein kinase